MGVLSQTGIAKVYLLPWKSSLVIIAAGVAGGLFYSSYAYIIAVAGYALPLVSADLRLLLYPIVALAALAGKKVNCPNCSPNGSIFK